MRTGFATCKLHLNDEYKNISSRFNIVGYPGMCLENKIIPGKPCTDVANGSGDMSVCQQDQPPCPCCIVMLFLCE